MSPDHREIRESLGSWAMDHLKEDERKRVDRHLETCAECRAEAESLQRTGRLLELVDPATVPGLSDQSPTPPPELEEKVLSGIDDPGSRRPRWKLFVPVAGAFAAAAIALVLVLGGSSQQNPGQEFSFSSLPPGVSIAGTLQPKATGTGIVVNVDGMRPGTLCRVYVRTSDGKLEPAGTFRYRYDGEEGESYPATLSTAWDLSEITTLVIKAGQGTFSTDI